ncbi:hypothetical protein Tco_1487835, partial [Tanacetum coccineum]
INRDLLARLEIQGYKLALESLESRILVHEKNELAWGEKYEFQNYELKCREMKINNLNLELEKVVKERDKDKTGLGYDTQLNEMSNNSETDSEISLSVFDVRSSDEENTPANDRFFKAVGFHVVPPPITGNFLICRDKVITEDLNSDDEDDVSEVQTFSPVKTNETQTVKTRVDKIVWDNTKRVNQQKFSKYPQLRKTFVPSGVLKRTGLITPVKQNKKRAIHKVSTARPVSTARLVSTARPVSTVRSFAPKITQTSGAIRPIYPRMDNVRPRGSYLPIKRSYYTKLALRPKDLKQDVKTFGVQNMTTAGTRAVVNTGKGKMDTDLKKSRWVWRPKGNYLDHVSKDSGSFMLKKVEYVDPKGISQSVMDWIPKRY